MWLGADPSLDLAQVAEPGASSNFSPVAGRWIWTGKKAPSTWLRFSLPLEKLGPGYGSSAGENGVRSQWFLVVKPSFAIVLDQISLYVPSADGAYEQFDSGALLSPRSGEPKSRYYVFELPDSAFSDKPYYLRVASATDVKLDLLLENGVEMYGGDTFEHLSYGIVLGIVCAMTIYGLFVFLSLKDRPYLYYALYSASTGIWLFFVQGFAKLLFGQHPGLDQAMLWFWAGAMISFGALFADSFLKPKEGKNLLHPVFVAMVVLGGFVVFAGLAGIYQMAFILGHWLGVALCLFVIGVATARLFMGFPSSLLFLIAWLLMAAGGLIFSLMGLKVLTVSFLTVHSVALGAATESIVLAMALSDRFRRLEEESRRLERIQARYRHLSLRDPLTGLHNRRYLDGKLGALAEASKTEERALSLVVVDIDDLKAINDGSGHDRGNEVIKVLARSLRACVRETDLSCRIGGDEFVVVMPGTKQGEACRVAERIRSHFALNSFSEQEKLTPTVSMGVAEYRAGEGTEELLKRADEAVYEAKRLGKDRVITR